MSQITLETLQKTLASVIDPLTQKDVMSVGLISGLVYKDGKVGFVITVEPDQEERGQQLRMHCKKAIEALDGVSETTIVLTAQGNTPIPPKPEAGYQKPRERAVWNLTPVEGVRHVIAVASGKGGVGKSTSTVNLAHAMAAQGLRVGILDADIYGPSIPRMLGVQDYGKPPIEHNKMLPATAHGIVCMSMGFITGDEAAMLRGPMISKTLHQLLRMTRWAGDDAPLDVLLVDMPPGTGDVHLSMMQQVPLSGAVIVTTPQEVAVMDARKGLSMFVRLNVPVMGVIENMSYMLDSNGSKIALFGSGGGQKLADEAKTLLLGAVPMDPQIVSDAERGTAYDGAHADAYQAIAEKLVAMLQSMPAAQAS